MDNAEDRHFLKFITTTDFSPSDMQYVKEKFANSCNYVSDESSVQTKVIRVYGKRSAERKAFQSKVSQLR